MKTYNKEKFWFLKDVYENGARRMIRKESVEGDYYFNVEHRWVKYFPFYNII